MVKELGNLEDVKFVRKSNVHGPDVVVMRLHLGDAFPMEIELDGDLPSKLEWAAHRAREHLDG